MTTTITLSTPIKQGESEISSMNLRRPVAGELRGIKLIELLQMDVSSLIVLLPRIAEPGLTEANIASMDPADLANVAAEVAGFFVTPQASQTV